MVVKLDSLPDEISLYLLQWLAVRDWCHLAAVSRHFYRVYNDDAIWKRRAHLIESQEGEGPSSRVCHTSLMYRTRMFVYGGHNPSPGSNFISDVKNELFSFDIGPSLTPPPLLLAPPPYLSSRLSFSPQLVVHSL